jgi:hypothetical protein
MGKGDDGKVYPLKGTLGWIVAVDYRTAKEWDYIWSILVDNRKKYGFGYTIEKAVNNPGQGTMIIIINWGMSPDGEVVRSIVECKSATNERSLQGEEVDWCIMSEAAEHDERIYNRFLSTRCRKLSLPTTPKIKAEWIHQLIEIGRQNPELSIESFNFTPRANPTYDWERFWIEHAKAESRVGLREFTEAGAHDCFNPAVDCQARKDPAFAEQFLGSWTYESDRVLPFRWEDLRDGRTPHVLHEVPDWLSDCRYAVSTDWGYRDPASAGFWAIGPDDTVVRCAEIYQSKLPPEDFVRRIEAKREQLGWNVSYYVGDPKKPEVAAIMRQRGLPVFIANKKKMADRAAGHLVFVDYLADDPAIGRPKLFVLSERCGEPYGCPSTIKEWKFLRVRGLTGNEFSTGAFLGNDHAYDDTRYFLMTNPHGSKPRTTADEIEKHRRFVLSLHKNMPSQQEGGYRGFVPEMVS